MKILLFLLLFAGFANAQKACGFKDGLQEGTCIHFYENGKKKEEVVWKKGKLNGDGIYYHENGNISAKGKFKNGFKVDEWLYFDDKNVKDGKEIYKNGEKNIYRNELIGTFYYPSGKMNETYKMIDGKKVGEDKIYFENGNVFRISHPDGKSEIAAAKEYDEKTGKLDAEGEIIVVDGKRNGIWTLYDAEEKTIGHYEKNIQTGKWQSFYPSGKLKRESTFVNGEREGKRIFYKEDGTLEKTETYKKGKLISTK